MIFSGDLCDKVLAGTKTQTRRPVKYKQFGDVGWVVAPCQYEAGKTYAIQRKRGTHGLGPRIRVLSVERVSSLGISEADARAEGFQSPAQFFARWADFYGTTQPQCWRIEFELDTATTADVSSAPDSPVSGSIPRGGETQ